MVWAHHCEVASIKGCNGVNAEAFGNGDDGGVGRSEGHVDVAAGQFCDSHEVGLSEVDETKVAGGKVLEEADLSIWAPFGLKQIGSLSHDGSGQETPTCRDRAHDSNAGFVIVVVGFSCSDQNAGVEEDHLLAEARQVLVGVASQVSRAALDRPNEAEFLSMGRLDPWLAIDSAGGLDGHGAEVCSWLDSKAGKLSCVDGACAVITDQDVEYLGMLLGAAHDHRVVRQMASPQRSPAFQKSRGHGPRHYLRRETVTASDSPASSARRGARSEVASGSLALGPVSGALSLFGEELPGEPDQSAQAEQPLADWLVNSLREALIARGFVATAERQQAIEAVVGRPVDSLRSLTRAEALRALDQLASASAPQTQSASSWDSRDEDTWIDRL